jgi:type IV pilus assembly protein PilB
MSFHPDAVALLRAAFDRPSDDTPKLVLADWLDDTGRPADAAWAAYIRARCHAARLPDAQPERTALLREAAGHASQVTARLEVAADSLVRDPAAILNLLPPDRLTVSLEGWVLPPELVEVVPESVARTCRVLSLSSWGATLYLAAADPADADNRQRLEFILNREIIFLRAAADEIDRAIEVNYPWGEVESVTEGLVIFPDPPAGYEWPTAGSDPPVVQLVNLILQDTIRLGAGWAEITPGPDAADVRFRIQDVLVERNTLPLQLLPAVVKRLTEMAGPMTSPDDTVAEEGTISVQIAGVHARFAVMLVPLPAGPTVWIERTG